jgi:hypothetical protein
MALTLVPGGPFPGNHQGPDRVLARMRVGPSRSDAPLMITTAPHTTPQPSARPREDVLPLLGFIAVAGPPPFVAMGAVVFGALMLAGPFAVIVTLVAAMALVVATVVVIAGAAVAIARSPFLALRHIRAHRPSNPFLLLGHRARVGHGARVVVRHDRIAS